MLLLCSITASLAVFWVPFHPILLQPNFTLSQTFFLPPDRYFSELFIRSKARFLVFLFHEVRWERMVSNELLFRRKHWPWITVWPGGSALTVHSCRLYVLLCWFFYHLENKPSQHSAEMFARFQSSRCRVFSVHLLTWDTNILQISIKGSVQPL